MDNEQIKAQTIAEAQERAAFELAAAQEWPNSRPPDAAWRGWLLHSKKPRAPLEIIEEFIEQSTHWREGGVDRHQALLAVKALKAERGQVDGGICDQCGGPNIAHMGGSCYGGGRPNMRQDG